MMDRLTDEQFINELERRADAFFNECINAKLEKIIDRVDAEEKWLIRIKVDNGFVSMADIQMSMSRIRHVVLEEKEGENNDRL